MFFTFSYEILTYVSQSFNFECLCDQRNVCCLSCHSTRVEKVNNVCASLSSKLQTPNHYLICTKCRVVTKKYKQSSNKKSTSLINWSFHVYKQEILHKKQIKPENLLFVGFHLVTPIYKRIRTVIDLVWRQDLTQKKPRDVISGAYNILMFGVCSNSDVQMFFFINVCYYLTWKKTKILAAHRHIFASGDRVLRRMLLNGMSLQNNIF